MIRRQLVGGMWKAKGRPDVAPGTAPSGDGTFTHGSEMPAALAAGQIGLKPGVTRTSVAAFTPTSGQTYQDLTISGEMNVDVDCTFINCAFVATGSTNGLMNCWSDKNVMFQHCQFDGVNDTDGAIKGGGVNCYRCEFRRCLKDFHGTDNVVFTECIGKEHWNKSAGDHRECVLRNSGSTMMLLRCYFVYEDVGAQNQYVSAAISCYNQPNSFGLTVQDCYVDGGAGGYALYGGGPSNTDNIKIMGNIFGRAVSKYSGYVAAIEDSFLGTAGSVISGNTWGPKGPANDAGDPAEGAAV